MRKLDWKDRGDGIHAARVMPNPMGMSIEADDRGAWRLYVTTPDCCEEIARGAAAYEGTRRTALDAAKRAVEAEAERLLRDLGRNLLAALDVDVIENSPARRDL